MQQLHVRRVYTCMYYMHTYLFLKREDMSALLLLHTALWMDIRRSCQTASLQHTENIVEW